MATIFIMANIFTEVKHYVPHPTRYDRGKKLKVCICDRLRKLSLQGACLFPPNTNVLTQWKLILQGAHWLPYIETAVKTRMRRCLIADHDRENDTHHKMTFKLVCLPDSGTWRAERPYVTEQCGLSEINYCRLIWQCQYWTKDGEYDLQIWLVAVQ